MIAFDFMLIPAAKEAGMKTPSEEQIERQNFDKAEYPHWHVYCMLQLGRRMPSAQSHFENAQIIAAIPDNQIRMVNFSDIENRGFV